MSQPNDPIPLSSGDEYQMMGQETYIRSALRGEAAEDPAMRERHAKHAIDRAITTLRELDPTQVESLVIIASCLPDAELMARHGPNARSTTLVTLGTVDDILNAMEIGADEMFHAIGDGEAEGDIHPEEFRV